MARLALALLAAAVLAGCGGPSSPAPETTVVASFYPLAWAAERVAGDGVEVVDLTPPGVEPHDLELSPGDVETVRDADLVLYLGRGFMPALEEALRDHPNAVDLLDAVQLLPAAEAAGHGEHEAGGEEHAHGDEEPAFDPHVWLDPRRFARIGERIAEALGRPEAASGLVSDLHGLEADFRFGLGECARREIVTSHAAFGYLAATYDLEQVALAGLSPEAEPSPRALERLVEEVRETGATTVFFETLVSPDLARTVAREAGATTAALDPLEGLSEERLEAGDDYLSVMRENLAALREALECR
jgi:zinc transport system substrate-binding protein